MSSEIIGLVTEADYHLFKHTNALFICKNDAQFTFVNMNSVCLKLLGYTRKQLAAKFSNSSMQIIHPNDRVSASNAVKKAAAQEGEKSFNVKLRVNSKKNGYYMVDFIGKLYENDGESLIAVAVNSGIRQIHFISEMNSLEDFMTKLKSLNEDNFFEYDINADVMVCSGMFTQRFDLPEVINNFSELIRGGTLLGPESRKYVNSAQLHAPEGETVSRKIKLMDSAGKHYWYMVHYRIYHDERGNPARAIGKMNDITPQQNEIDSLIKLSETDSLTGLYNRASSEALIKECLHRRRGGDSHGHTLMIIDIDNFKEVNDSIGHMYGDAVLTQLSDSLKDIFRSDDVIGRLGGDEFFVLVKNCHEDSVIGEKADEVCNAFRKTFVEVGTPVNISASIGISKAPLHGDDFESLYRCADTALYTVKAGGKDGYAIYKKDMGKPQYASKRTELDSDINGAINLNHNTTEFVFKMFRDSKNISHILPAVLKLLTEKYNFSKGHIFEATNNIGVEKTFSWDNEAVFGQNDVLNSFPIEAFSQSFSKLMQSGVFVVNSKDDLASEEERVLIAEAGVKAMLVYPIISKSDFNGIIVFEDSVRERSFAPETIEDLETISSIISSFLISYRLEERLRTKQR